VKIESGQVAVITGGASGIGYGLAQQLGARGVRLVLADVREDGLAEAAQTLGGAGHEVLTVLTDVSNPVAVQGLADRTMAHFGRVDLVCNNAGVVCEQAPMWEQEPATWSWLVGIKYMGVVHGVRAFAPLLIAQGSGHILNTASAGGLMPLPMMTPYNGTMHAVVGMTETLDLELKQAAPALGATVLCPGLVATPLAANSAALKPAGAAATPIGEDGAEVDTTQYGSVLSPTEVAESAIAAIEEGRVHAIVGGDTAAMARARAESVLADIPPAG